MLVRLTKWGKDHVVAEDQKHTLCGQRLTPKIKRPRDQRLCVQCSKILWDKEVELLGGTPARSRLKLRRRTKDKVQQKQRYRKLREWKRKVFGK